MVRNAGVKSPGRAIVYSWIATVIVLAGSGACGAQRRLLTLGDAVSTALTANLDLKQAATATESRRLALRRNKSDFLPSLSLSVRTSESWSKDYDSLLDSYEGATSRSLSLGVSSSLELFRGLARINALERSKLDLEADEQSYVRTRQSVLYDAVSRFMQAALDGEILSVNEANLDAQRRSLEHIDAFYEAGKRPVADLYQQQAAVASAEASLLEARRRVEISILRLVQTMGGDPAVEYGVVKPDAERLMTALDSLVRGIDVDGALEKRRDVISQRKSVQAAEKQIAVSRAGYWPSVSLSASLGTSYRDPTFVPGGYADQFDRNLNASIGVSASLSIFDRFQTRNSVSQAKIDLRRSRISLENLELRSRVEAAQALADYETAREAVEVAEAQLAYSEQALMNIEERYRLNLSTLLELLQARASYVQSSYSVVRSKYDLIMNAVAVLYAADDIERSLPLFE